MPAFSVCPLPSRGAGNIVATALLSWLYAISRSAEAAPVAPLLLCMVPFTFPKPVLEPLFEPTFPVRWVMLVLPMAPLEVKSTKLAAVPKEGGVWAKRNEQGNIVAAASNEGKFSFI